MPPPPASPSLMVEWPATEALLEQLRVWARPLQNDLAFRAFNRRKIRSALDLYDDEPRETIEDFEMPTHLAREHDAVMAFYHLHSASDRMQGMHLYFRRFPFRGSEMRKVEHLQNVFDLFFGGIYIVLQRLQTYLNSVAPLCDVKPDVGRVVKRFRKDFDSELRPRNLTIHDRPYDDIVFDRLWVSEMMAFSERNPEVWQREHLALYRRETRRLAELAQKRSRALLVYLEAAAEYTLNHAAFLGMR
jgi:hypothetical protein